MMKSLRNLLVLVNLLGQSDAVPATEKSWWKDTYYRVPSHEFDNKTSKLIILKPDELPKKHEGKKRIVMMGDSLMTDDEDTGWSHHLAYLIGQEKLPFDVINLSRSGATIAPPAHIFTLKDGEGKNCYGAQTKGNEWFSYRYHYQDTVHGKNRWELGAASKADYVLLQIGANDITP